jgi:hypothetical protein
VGELGRQATFDLLYRLNAPTPFFEIYKRGILSAGSMTNEQINNQNIDNPECFGVKFVKIYPEITSQ